MIPVLLLGAGKIGSAVAKLLGRCGDYDVRVGDVDARALWRLRDVPNVTAAPLDVSSAADLAAAMTGRRAVLSALSFDANPAVARSALAGGLSYFDLTEDVATTRAVAQVAAAAADGQVFMPQCGLAPGFVSIAAYDLTKRFERVDEVRMRVGALPKFPTNEMKYNLTWSTDGLINEYGNPCQAVHRGRLIEVLPLEGLEHFSLDGVDYEAFNTSGGVGTLAQTLAGQVRTLDYKTIRYRGHRDLMAFLMIELRLSDRRAVLKDILERAVPATPQDIALIFCTVSGQRDGRLTQLTDARKIYHATVHGEEWSAIQLTTASALCAAVDLHFAGRLSKRGLVRQEEVSLDEFLGNRFGRVFAGSADDMQMQPQSRGGADTDAEQADERVTR
jgi:saccharopine dehydrogenase-like NADP-dependent oxidoreductase